MNREKHPLHPGRFLRIKLQVMRISFKAAARALNVDRSHFSELLNGGVGISSEMAIRLAQALGGTAEDWRALQTDFEIARLREEKRELLNIERIPHETK